MSRAHRHLDNLVYFAVAAKLVKLNYSISKEGSYQASPKLSWERTAAELVQKKYYDVTLRQREEANGCTLDLRIIQTSPNSGQTRVDGGL